MPKTSKKSKASKSTGLRKRFDLTNKKVQFFVVIAIVAILGGGWFTYKSFAATDAWTMNPSQNVFFTAAQSPCTSKVVNDAAKNNTKVANLVCPSVQTSQGKEASVAAGIPGFSTGAGTFRVCAMISGKGYAEIEFIANDNRTVSIHEINSSGYTKYCTNNKSLANGINSFAAAVTIAGNGNPKFPQFINVSGITLEKTGTISAGTSSAGGAIK